LIAVTVALCFWLHRHVPVFSKIRAGMLAIVLGALVSNLGIVPAASPVYGIFEGPVTLLGYAIGTYLGFGVASLVRVFGF